MLKSICNKYIFMHKILLHSRASYSCRPVIDTSYVWKAKPEDIPEGIWAEDKDPKYTAFEEVKGHWYYVERLFPKLRIPDPPQTHSSTGWKAPAENIPNLPYYVKRSRNHMLPVYLLRMYKDRVQVTAVKRIHGDIWIFEHELKTYLEEQLGESIESNVNEICCRVNFKGSHIDIISNWLLNKGF